MPIPKVHRPALRAELDALARGERPGLMTWVGSYGRSGAELVLQPEEIWTHPDSDLQVRPDGTAWGSVPLWTTDAHPSDLAAEFEVDPGGAVTLEDVRVP